MKLFSFLPLLIPVLAWSAPSDASAQCGGAILCAGVQFGAHVAVAPPPVYTPPVVVVQPAAPPVPAPVVVQPAPAPVVVVQQPVPAPVVVARPAPAPAPTGYVPPRRNGRPLRLGLHGHLGGVFSPDIAVGGVTGALRVRPPQGPLAVDLGIGLYGGQDFEGLDRVEVPLTADGLLFLNPRAPLQVYGVLGLGFSFAHVEGVRESTGEAVDRRFAYVGGQVGAGLELRLTSQLALNADLRAFLRTRIDDNAGPEFVEVDDRGEPTGRVSDTSSGGVLNIGGTLYF